MAFGDGLRCASGTVVRLAVRHAQAGALSFGAAVPGAPLVSSAGAISAAGATHTYQVWYRDPAPFCTSDPWNLSQGLSIGWLPQPPRPGTRFTRFCPG